MRAVETDEIAVLGEWRGKGFAAAELSKQRTRGAVGDGECGVAEDGRDFCDMSAAGVEEQSDGKTIVGIGAQTHAAAGVRVDPCSRFDHGPTGARPVRHIGTGIASVNTATPPTTTAMPAIQQREREMLDPGFRGPDTNDPRFYGAYLRDLDGNEFAVSCMTPRAAVLSEPAGSGGVVPSVQAVSMTAATRIASMEFMVMVVRPQSWPYVIKSGT